MGIDPGTTLGFAILDLTGNILAVSSSKQMELSSLITEVTHYGKPVIVGCDKKNVPDFVQKWGTKTGSRIYAPDHDLTTQEKKEDAAHGSFENSHEMDALASAVYAYKRFKPTLEKILGCMAPEEEEFAEFVNLVIEHKLNLKHARELLKRDRYEKMQPQKELVLSAVRKPEVREKTLLQLYQQIKKLTLRTSQLQEKNEHLKEQLTMQKRINRQLHQKQQDTGDKTLQRKDRKIDRLHKVIQKRDEHIEQQKEEKQRLRELLTWSRKQLIVPRLQNLTTKEYRRHKEKLVSHDPVYVDRPDIFSQTVLRHLEEQQFTLLHPLKHPPAAIHRLPIVTICSEELEFFDEHEEFLVVERESYERAKHSSHLLDKIVSDHRKERGQSR